ncbi:MAG TPA: hypothetical protein ENN67_00440 [Firmicutes bacterium]|nr:hypothetical protein [Bacillota bacterium]
MGINEIRDGRESLLTERLENLRRVQRREGEAGGGGREFQQLFEFAEKEKREEERKSETSKPEPSKNETPPPPMTPPRAITPEEIEKVKKRNELTPGQLIDLEI